MALLVSVLHRLSDQPPGILELSFQHPGPSDISEYLRIFRVRPRFSQKANRLLIERTFLERTISLADPVLLEMLETHARKILQIRDSYPGWSSRTVEILKEQMHGRLPALEATARRLGTGGRSLQARLKREGTSYRKLLDDVRREMALELMKNPDVPLCEIALLCGFAEQSSFTHAFRRWTGQAPGNYLRSRRLSRC